MFFAALAVYSAHDGMRLRMARAWTDTASAGMAYWHLFFVLEVAAL